VQGTKVTDLDERYFANAEEKKSGEQAPERGEGAGGGRGGCRVERVRRLSVPREN
jgi:hypothetical protein